MTEIVCGACGDFVKTIPDRFEGDEDEITVWCEKCQIEMKEEYEKYASKKFKDWNKRILELVKK